MKKVLALLSMVTALAFVCGDLAFAGEEKDPLKSRAPREAKKIDPPENLYKDTKTASAEIIAEGKKIFEGPVSIATAKQAMDKVLPEKC